MWIGHRFGTKEFFEGMDCRVEPGNDVEDGPSQAPEWES
jgi:hypothetical protein